MKSQKNLLDSGYGKVHLFPHPAYMRRVAQFMGKGILNGYCYGPADLVRAWKGPSILWLQLCDSVGKQAEAIYEGCAYLPKEKGYAGMHLSLVQQLTASQLRSNGFSGAAASDCPLTDALLQKWEKEGMKFYLHIGTRSEFLVVAKNLNYRMID